MERSEDRGDTRDAERWQDNHRQRRARTASPDTPAVLQIGDGVGKRAPDAHETGRGNRHDDLSPVPQLLAAREDGRWGTTHENAAALEALVRYFRAMEAVEPDMTATVEVDGASIASQTFVGRSDEVRTIRVALDELAGRLGPDRAGDLVVGKSGNGRLYYTARLAYDTSIPAEAEARGIHITRQYERYVPDGEGEVTTSFALGEVVRVRLRLDLPREGRFLAVTDRLPAGFEPIDAAFATTASDLAEEATRQSSDGDWRRWWRAGGFDHSEKHDDRVLAFATRLAPGRHEFSYLARATTSGAFTAAGASAEAMYAPEVTGRSATSSVTVR